MSRFEYISIAIALIYTLAAGRLLAGLAPSLDSARRYWPHALWVIHSLLIVAVHWWSFWRLHDVEWNGFRFLWALSIPAILFVRAGILVGDNPGTNVSFRDHFFEHRVSFFAVGALAGLDILLTPWTMGIVPWLTSAPATAPGLGIITISLVGLARKDTATQIGLVAVAILIATVGLSRV